MWREEGYQAELKRTRKELRHMRADFEKRIKAAEKAKRAWVGPLLQGTASGGLGLAGTLITAGELDFLWHFSGVQSGRIIANGLVGMLCVVQ